jgi:hypothetical protein
MRYSASSSHIELNITKAQARQGSHMGKCDADIADLCKVPAIKRQLDKLDPALVASELRDYGAWDEKELADHEANLGRLLWLACGGVNERLTEHSHAT